ncbi:hypothetical protein LJB91_01140 [Bacteroidales bacterium OttesenSCG-928-L03]|nr:hypothetical protein [Bacteroidales bacterium OttesenSCG-928-L03]
MKKHWWIIILLATFLILVGILFYYLRYRVMDEVSMPKPADTEEVDSSGDSHKKPKPPKPTETPDPMETDSISEELEIGELDSLAIDEEMMAEELVLDETKPLHIPYCKSAFNTTNISIENLPSGKTYYQAGQKRIESTIIEHEGRGFCEHLISYDPQGNKADELEIGLLDPSGERKKYAVISQNKVMTYILSTDKDGKVNETVTEYTITPTLRFSKGKTYVKVL